MQPPPQSLVGRLAPSPTGLLHVGHARSFLLAWWSIRSRGGRIVLRIEDLDTERARPEFTAGILEDLEWLGMDWDDQPLIQSASQPDFERALNQLIESGHVYPCVCTRREVRDASAPHDEAPQSQTEAPYPGTCRGRFQTAAEATAQTGRQVCWRFRVPETPVLFEDLIAGSQSINLATQGGDFIVARRDGQIAYQLAVVIDDAKSAITEVLRGDDLLVSTARQILLYRALGLSMPTWAHTPLVIDNDQERLAKRTDALSLKALRASGVTLSQIIAWAAKSSGQAPIDHTSPQAFLAQFDLSLVPREPVQEPRF